MLVLGINKICGWCQVTSGGRRYTCPIKTVNGKLYFHFKKEWHEVAEFTSEYTEELIEEDGKTFSRPYRE